VNVLDLVGDLSRGHCVGAGIHIVSTGDSNWLGIYGSYTFYDDIVILISGYAIINLARARGALRITASGSPANTEGEAYQIGTEIAGDVGAIITCDRKSYVISNPTVPLGQGGGACTAIASVNLLLAAFLEPRLLDTICMAIADKRKENEH
jgi:hypothetical protein